MAFKKGISGNPAGRPKGATAALARELRERLAERADELLAAAINAALAGDTAMLKFLLERLLPDAADSDSGEAGRIEVVFVSPGGAAQQEAF
jgi:hypothetical protein